MPGGTAELRRQEYLIAHALDGFAKAVLRARRSVVGRGVEVGDAALDGFAYDGDRLARIIHE